ncbi:MAG: dTMP kinase [Armatimonadetes bacterium]|nr:dTMP kinase [Armatimonadota bacterium]
MVIVGGLFITIEGIDGSGKTTQAELLVARLRSEGYTVCQTREPGGSPVGEELRALVLSPAHAITPEAELFLYLADRALHVSRVVRPALEAGELVVCERHADSTLAYQGFGRGLDVAFLRQLNQMATGGLQPDLTVVLDLDARDARLDGARLDRLESEGQEFLARVAAGFRELTEGEPERMKLIDASRDIQVVHEDIAAAVMSLVQRRPPSRAATEEGL